MKLLLSVSEDLQDKFAQLLQITGLTGDKLKKRIQSRLVGLDFGATCSRCGGSGSYSFNMMDGSRCYGCGGTGFVAQKLTPKLYTQVEAVVHSGKLDQYLNELRRKAKLKEAAKNASSRVLKIWGANNVEKIIPGYAAHIKEVGWVAKDPKFIEIQNINGLQNKTYQGVSHQEHIISHFEFKRKNAKTPEERLALEKQIDVELEHLIKLTDIAIDYVQDLLKLAIEVDKKFGSSIKIPELPAEIQTASKRYFEMDRASRRVA